MKTKLHPLLLTLALFAGATTQLFAQGTAFAYQGRLNINGSQANGLYDLRFTVCDALTNGNIIAGPLTNSATGVTNGLFAVTLDFGAGVFNGTARWLQLDVRTNGAASFTALLPLQQVQPVPYAIFANTASNVSGTVPAAQIAGTILNASLPASPSFSGTVAAATFAGNGGSVTNLNANNLAGGTVPLARLSDITSNQLDAATWQLATNLNGGNAALASNVVSGIAITNAFITNSVFAGNGSGLTNLNAAQLTGTVPLARLPAAVVTNNETAITLSGTFTGNVIGSASAATNFTGALNGDVTGTQNATVVAAVGGQPASSVAAGASAANNATNAATPNTIVERDAAGGFSATNLNLNGSLTLPAVPTVYSGGNVLLHADGNANFFAGPNARNLAAICANNTAMGYCTLNNNHANNNTAIGSLALSANTNGVHNTAIGVNALQNNLGGGANMASGGAALASNITGNNNTAAGDSALNSNTNGNFNTAAGYAALFFNTSGNYNIGLGFEAGMNVIGSSNIDIGNFGVATDTNIIRIGSAQTSTFIAGISGATVASGVAVYVNPSGQLGALTSSQRYKQDIRNMNDASDALLALHPVTFRYKPDIDPAGIPQFGLVAEEVEKVNPDLVAHDDQGRPYTVRYEAVNAMLLNEFLKEHKKVEAQNTEIQDLKQSVAELKQMVQTLAEKK